MSVTVANTANTNTFDYWRNRTNELAYAMSTYAVTAGGSNTTSGNAAITGSFTANALIVNTSINVGNSTVNGVVNSTIITIGNSSVNAIITSQSLTVNSVYIGINSANIVANTSALKISNSTSNIALTIPTSSQVSSGEYFLSANGSWTAINTSSSATSITLSGLSTQDVDSFTKSSILAAEYVAHVKDNTANNKSVSKLLVLHDGGTSTSNSFVTEYAVINTNNSIGAWSTYTNTTHTILQFTPTSSNVTINYIRTAT